MRCLVAVAALVACWSIASPGFGYGLCDLLGFGPAKGCGASCCCEPGCEVGCACEIGCACEPACGCGDCCGIDGRQFAGQRWQGCCDTYVPLDPCVCGDSCAPCGCGDCCEIGCACEPACGACGCGSGCGDPCGCGSRTCCLKYCGFGTACGTLIKAFSCLCDCGGCSGEVYWSEWHNDPPRCYDPCDCYGNWTGPSPGYRAPYSHPYSPSTQPAAYVQNRPAAPAKTIRTASGQSRVERRQKAAPKPQW